MFNLCYYPLHEESCYMIVEFSRNTAIAPVMSFVEINEVKKPNGFFFGRTEFYIYSTMRYISGFPIETDESFTCGGRDPAMRSAAQRLCESRSSHVIEKLMTIDWGTNTSILDLSDPDQARSTLAVARDIAMQYLSVSARSGVFSFVASPDAAESIARICQLPDSSCQIMACDGLPNDIAFLAYRENGIKWKSRFTEDMPPEGVNFFETPDGQRSRSADDANEEPCNSASTVKMLCYEEMTVEVLLERNQQDSSIEDKQENTSGVKEWLCGAERPFKDRGSIISDYEIHVDRPDTGWRFDITFP